MDRKEESCLEERLRNELAAQRRYLKWTKLPMISFEGCDKFWGIKSKSWRITRNLTPELTGDKGVFSREIRKQKKQTTWVFGSLGVILPSQKQQCKCRPQGMAIRHLQAEVRYKFSLQRILRWKCGFQHGDLSFKFPFCQHFPRKKVKTTKKICFVPNFPNLQHLLDWC